MTWSALVSAAVGALLALTGSLAVEIRRDRQERHRGRETERRRSAVEFALALIAALGALRDVARAGDGPGDRVVAAAGVLNDAGLYAAREQLLISGTPSLVAVAEDAFHCLIEVRNAVRSGEGLDSLPYHNAYHDFSASLWRFRLAVRADLGERVLSPADIRQQDWSDRQRCRICGRDTSDADEHAV